MVLVAGKQTELILNKIQPVLGSAQSRIQNVMSLFLVPSVEFLNTWSSTPSIRLHVVKLNQAPSNKISTDFTWSV